MHEFDQCVDMRYFCSQLNLFFFLCLSFQNHALPSLLRAWKMRLSRLGWVCSCFCVSTSSGESSSCTVPSSNHPPLNRWGRWITSISITGSYGSIVCGYLRVYATLKTWMTMSLVTMGFERRRNLLTTKEGKNKTRKEAAWPEKIYDFNIGHFFEIEKKKHF